LVNGARKELFDEAHDSRADQIILDIEDAVDPARKPDARADVVDYLSSGEKRAWVRINDHSTPFWADDVAALADHLGIDRLIPVGYSMGGLVAQLVWRRHPERVTGLALCSTSRNVSGALWEQSAAFLMPGLVAAAMWMPGARALRADLVGSALLDHDHDPADRQWALSEMRRTSLVDALAAMQSACEFTSHTWIGSVDVPTAVVITRHDRIVAPNRQRKLARALPGATVIELAGGHDVFLGSPRRFAAAVESACAAVSTGGAQATAAIGA
jgi:diacylglycerol O-acyltransferase